MPEWTPFGDQCPACGGEMWLNANQTLAACIDSCRYERALTPDERRRAMRNTRRQVGIGRDTLGAGDL